jgi:hypothetical protein
MSNYTGLIWTIWSQEEGLIPSQIGLRRLIYRVVRFVIDKINLTDIFWIGLEWRKVEDSGGLSAFIEGFVMSWRQNLPIPNLPIPKPSYAACIIYPKARFVKQNMPIKT